MAKKKKTSSKNNKSLLSRITSPASKTTSENSEGYGLNLSTSTYLKSFGFILAGTTVIHLFGLFRSGGYLGELLVQSLVKVFGIFGYLFFIVLGYFAYHLIRQATPNVFSKKKMFGLVFALSLLSFIAIVSPSSINLSGAIGLYISKLFISLFSFYPSVLFITAFLMYSLAELLGANINTESLKDKYMTFKENGFKLPEFKIFPRKGSDDSEIYIDDESDTEEVDIRSQILSKTKAKEAVPEENDEYETEEEIIETKRQKKLPLPLKVSTENKKTLGSYNDLDFTPPPLSLLQRDSGKASVGDTKANMVTIKRTLAEFGIQVEMDEVSIGPSVTRYALKPAQGVKLSRIANHRQELAYALRAESIRIEAPIPGRALVGIEIPNQSKSTVGLASLLSHPKWSEDARPLMVALGKGISGTPLYSNLAKMPHVLIAGTTGSGKSVMVHAIVNSLLFRNDPSMLKFIMVDPKKVELTLYNNIPHLYTPVITNAKLAIRTLNWAVNEMERRYDTLEENGVRDISSYHKDIYLAAKNKKGSDVDDMPEKMPYIVIIIDELADIMMSYPKELEAAIVRLAQKSRAVGIHLILSTQRPSVNVITGLIKANVPSRIALKVASQIDSRTIIDTAGAEQLLGQGDLLFTSSESPKQERVQSAFVSDAEVKNVVEYLKKKYRDYANDEINIESTPGGDKTMNALFGTDLGSVGGGDTDDDLYEQAKEIIISSGKASTSYLQRRLKVGYSRAARLMDMLEERGVIGAADGSKAREVLVSSDSKYSDDEDVENGENMF